MGDFNADNRPDLAVANLNNSVVSVLLNTLTARLNITQHPARATVQSGQSASFSVTATGTGPITCQWRNDGVNMVNGGPVSVATSPTPTINPVALADIGAAFDCFLSRACGSVRTNPICLVIAPTFAHCIADIAFINAFAAGC